MRPWPDVQRSKLLNSTSKTETGHATAGKSLETNLSKEKEGSPFCTKPSFLHGCSRYFLVLNPSNGKAFDGALACI